MIRKMTLKNFAGIDRKFSEKESASIILQSYAYDGTSTWGKGADKGFDAFLEAAENMELYDIETASEVYKKGIYVSRELYDFDSPEEMFAVTYNKTKKLLQLNKFLTFFGGEHSISIGIINAFNEYFKDLTVLQLDAHADLRPSYNGSAYNHACAMHQASKATNLIQVGIRSMDVSEQKYINEFQCYYAHEMHNTNGWIKESINQMTDNVYITLDLDVFDPSIMPSTGTPEPDGLNFHTVTTYLKEVFANKNVVGFDIVELAPIKGINAPDFLVAKLYYKMLSYKFFS